VEERFLHITWTRCTAHCLGLLLEDSGKLGWAKDVIKEGKDLVQFISNHHKTLAVYRDHSDRQLLRLGKACVTTSLRDLKAVSGAFVDIFLGVLYYLEKWLGNACCQQCFISAFGRLQCCLLLKHASVA
jgi:hypothetical protein